MLKGEFYKVIRSKSIVLLFIVMLVLNCFQILYVNYQNIHGDLATGKKKILKIIEGPISQDNYDWLIDYHNNMLRNVNEGHYNTKNKSKKTFSGYVFGDEQITKNLLDDYEYAINYESLIKKKITILNENIKNTKNNDWKNENKKLKNRLENRRLSYYYDYTLINNFISQDFQYLLLLIFCIILIIKLFITEKQSKTDFYFYTINNQLKKVFLSKIITTILCIIITSLIFLIESYLIYFLLGMKYGLFQPLYALSNFMYVPYNISILFYIICNYFYHLFGYFTFSWILVFLYHFIDKEYQGLFIGIFIIFISIKLFNNNLLSIISFTSLNDVIFYEEIFFQKLVFSFIISSFIFITYFLYKRRYHVSIN